MKHAMNLSAWYKIKIKEIKEIKEAKQELAKFKVLNKPQNQLCKKEITLQQLDVSISIIGLEK